MTYPVAKTIYVLGLSAFVIQHDLFYYYHCMYTALLEKNKVRGILLIERYLLGLLNSSL